MGTRVPVTFEPANVTVWVDPGVTVGEAARMAGIIIAAPCGGRGVCGSCGVRVLDGELATADEVEAATLRRAGPSVRLSCRARVKSAVSVRPIVVGPRAEEASTHGEAASLPLVAGVDLGTTSIAAVLIDPTTGQELSRAVAPNPQQAYGADVLTRMSAAIAGSSADLRSLAEQGIIGALQGAATGAGVSLKGVKRLAVAGNTAMTALLLGADTSSLAVYPFSPPPMSETLPGGSAVLEALPIDAELTVLPPIAGFVGGDALAATLAAGMVDADEPTLLVDFGTNAEIILAGAGTMVVASAAAGPAFEGVGVSCGGPAALGAATRVRIAGDGLVRFDTLGPEPARWFSGSGLVSAVAELRRCGHIDAGGLFHVDGPLADSFERGEGDVLAIRLGDGAAGCLTLTQLDVRTLQLAKAAVRVGVSAVLSAAGVQADDLRRLLIAGAFGSALEPDDLIALGVLPAGLALSARRIGNAALDGAAVVALDPGVMLLAERAARSARHVDLALDEGFARALMIATELAPYSI